MWAHEGGLIGNIIIHTYLHKMAYIIYSNTVKQL